MPPSQVLPLTSTLTKPASCNDRCESRSKLSGAIFNKALNNYLLNSCRIPLHLNLTKTSTIARLAFSNTFMSVLIPTLDRRKLEFPGPRTPSPGQKNSAENFN